VHPAGHDPDLHALIDLAVVAGATDTSRLAALRDRSWPAGGDGSIPNARDWLRRWGPRRTVAATPACTRPHAHCPVCN
jgi:hypothetical protein